jgi:ribose-phosphate pyrophosphokinase
MKIFAGSSNLPLAQEIAQTCKKFLGASVLERFSDGEIHYYIDENVRGEDIFIIQSGCHPANAHMMELFLMIDAFKRASAERITAVMPYYAYGRQDWKDRPRVPISARLMADLLVASGANRILTMDLHSPQIQGFFSIPVDNLTSVPVLTRHLLGLGLGQLTVVSPDAGGVGRAKHFAKKLGAKLAIIDKRRPRPNVAEVFNVIGDVAGETCVLYDDMVDTAGTLVLGAEAVKKAGAARVLACATHAVLSGPAIKRLEDSPIEQLILTNTIPLTDAGKGCKKIMALSVAELFGEAIRRINERSSVSSLFD